MDKIRLFLILITLATTLGPVLGIMILYRNNLLGLFAPPEVTELVSGTFVKEGSLEPPKLVSSEYDVKSRTVTLTFNFTNPFNFDLTLMSMSANVECAVHRVPLGVAVLKTPVNVLASETSLITVFCTWTQDATSHFQSAHAGAKSIDVDLVGLAIDTSGINIQMKERINIPNVPIA
jgi:hypothetical protein